MLRKHLVLLIACLALFAASCSTGGDDDSGDDGGGDQTTSEPTGNDDEEGEEDGDDDETTVTTTTDGDDDDDGGTSSGGGGSREDYVDAMIQSIVSDDESMPLAEDQAECLSEAWIDIFDPERLAAAGIAPEDLLSDDDSGMDDVRLSEDEANAMVDTFGDCDIDVTAMFIASFEEDQTLTPEDRTCLENTFNEDFLRRLFVMEFTQGGDAVEDDPELMGELMAAVFACPGAMGLEEGDL